MYSFRIRNLIYALVVLSTQTLTVLRSMTTIQPNQTQLHWLQIMTSQIFEIRYCILTVYYFLNRALLILPLQNVWGRESDWTNPIQWRTVCGQSRPSIKKRFALSVSYIYIFREEYFYRQEYLTWSWTDRIFSSNAATINNRKTASPRLRTDDAVDRHLATPGEWLREHGCLTPHQANGEGAHGCLVAWLHGTCQKAFEGNLKNC